MTSKILTTNDNNKQYCKGCEKTLPLNLFTVNGKSFRTCNTWRVQNKEVYQRKMMQNNADVDRVMVDFHDFDDYIADLFENMNNSTNKENHEFKLSCTIKSTRLEGDLKEWANCNI
ncbi:unnamed protein product [Rhizophagus irregularis]|nr:unnamed protein product [Rhizophagus irregularis]CAB5391521.1 unnamed protein product [Rhizophagus irregularis]